MSHPKQEVLGHSARKRSKNYTTEEEMLLVDLVAKHKNIIENKKSDSIIWREKTKAWQIIEEDFEANIGMHRPWKTLREKYEMMKRKSRMEIAEQKSGASSVKISALSRKVAAMLGDSAEGSRNHSDSDSFDDCGYVECYDGENESCGCDQRSSSQGISDSSSSKPANLKRSISNGTVAKTKRKRSLEDEKMELVILQQKFFKNEDRRAQEKHEQELFILKLKAQNLQLEFDQKALQNGC